MTQLIPPALRNRETRAIITGGTQGLGLAIAEELASEGAEAMVLAGRDPDKGAHAVRHMHDLGVSALFVACDVARVEECWGLIDRGVAFLGTANALVNAAGATDRGGLLDTTPELWAKLMDTNARGPFFLMQRFVAHARRLGHGGSIVNILSMVIHCGQSYLAPYSASKAALALLTKNVATAHRRDHIRVNGIAVGWMDTPGEDAVQRQWHGAQDGWLEEAEAKQPFGQLVKPDEVAGLAAYLLSPASGVMTGAIIDHDQNVAGANPE
ncbi:MAG TPA: SDR family oxidoreductase [Paracoccaceae bacterium]|nr:SDR family oxidoreductase [Paracoccaceae bacterium]